MKGGVGKTTISANVSRVLFERKKIGTLLLDLDPQFNLTQALFKREDYDALKGKNKTILPVFERPQDVSLFSISKEKSPPPSAEAIGKTLYHFPKSVPEINLSVIPGDFQLVKYSLMDDTGQLKIARGRFLEFIENEKKNYGLIVIDCNPSSSFLTLCALHACTHILVPVRADKYSILGLEMLNDFVQSLHTVPKKPEFIIAMNEVPRSKDKETASIESELRAHSVFGAKTMVAAVKKSSHLRAKTDYTGFATDRRGAWTDVLRKDIATFADELASKLGV